MLHDILRRPIPLHALSHYILTRGLILAGVLLCCAGAIAALGRDPWLAGWYARYLLSMSAVLAGAALIGPLLLEDVLRHVS